MSEKRNDNVSESSSDEEYGHSCKSSCSSNDKCTDYCTNTLSRKRNTSLSSFKMTGKRSRDHSKKPCMNKNAQAARENRIRKKIHLEQVENKLSFHQQKNKNLVNIIQKQDINIKRLKGEVSYLRCILKNNTNITAILQSINEGLSKTSNNKELTSRGDLKCHSKSANGNYNSEHQQQLLQSSANTQLLKTNNESRSEFDHTYTIPKTQSTGGINLNNEHETEDEKHDKFQNYKNSVFGDEMLLDFEKETSITSPLNNSAELFDSDISDVRTDKWSGLNVNNYNNFINFDDGSNPSNNLDTLTNLSDNLGILEQFRDAGICLHVNSEKVSLEYCSICHMNSLNSMPE